MVYDLERPYSFLFLDGLTAVIGAWTAAALPALVLLLWLAALAWLLAQLRLAAGVAANLALAVLTAAVILGATVSAIPNLAQSIYWKGGLLTGAAPLAAGALLAAPPSIAASHVVGQRADARNYATTWDSFDRQLRAARASGAGSFALPRQDNPGGIDNYAADPQFWVNQCAQLYYGVAVSAFEPPPVPSAIALAHRQRLEAAIGGAVPVIGYRLDQTRVRAGEILNVTVYWQPIGGTLQPQTIFLHLYDPAAGRSLAQVDRTPGDGRYPTTLWIHGRIFADNFALELPAGKLPANAAFILGHYDPANNQRLPVTGPDPGPAGSDWVQFGQVEVEP